MQNPFEYNMVEQEEFISFYTQRNAKYKKVAEQSYNPNALESYVEDKQPPTPQIMEIDGYDAEETNEIWK